MLGKKLLRIKVRGNNSEVWNNYEKIGVVNVNARVVGGFILVIQIMELPI